MRLTARHKRKSYSPHHVMVVEDDAVLGMQIEQVLRDSGVNEVTICPTASCSLERLKTSRPDVVILDVHLADRDDGWGIAEMIDAIGGSGPRIIFQTGSPQDIPSSVARLGPVLEKPYDPQDLVRLVSIEPKKRGIFPRLRRH